MVIRAPMLRFYRFVKKLLGSLLNIQGYLLLLGRPGTFWNSLKTHWNPLKPLWNPFNLTLYGGGYIVSPPRISCSGGPNIEPRGTKFWYNSYFIVTMDIPNVLNPKGVPKKFEVCFLKQGSKIKISNLIQLRWNFAWACRVPIQTFFVFWTILI